jgi:hypothetical protein
MHQVIFVLSVTGLLWIFIVTLLILVYCSVEVLIEYFISLISGFALPSARTSAQEGWFDVRHTKTSSSFLFSGAQVQSAGIRQHRQEAPTATRWNTSQ